MRVTIVHYLLVPLVLCDIVGQMFDEKFLVKIFTPGVLLSNREVRLVFDKLAHASFMRLNASSMDKVCVCVCVCVFYSRFLHTVVRFDDHGIQISSKLLVCISCTINVLSNMYHHC